ncbi:MAG: hypothetical protein DSY60_00990 [Persephonella sp.]|nr:MAG: hypothetical protein DSY60_00990 [Persephonella sp.]
MIDIEFLNEKATKFKRSLSKVKQILDLGYENFIKTPMYPDRAQYYALFTYDELDKIACHLLKEISNLKKKEDCILDLANEQIFSEKLNRTFIDFYNFRDTLFKNEFKYPPEKMYPLLKNFVDTLDSLFLKELASIVKELKSKEKKLKYPVNIKKLNEQATVLKSMEKKLKTFAKYSLDEFKNSPYFIDRTRYYLVSLADASSWICRHLSRKMGLKTGKECFKGLMENNVLSTDVAIFFQELNNLKETLANPEKEVMPELLYKIITEKLNLIDKFLREIAKTIY